MEEIIEAYLKGSRSVELDVIASLRRLGEGYARRRGFKGFDVDAAGVDFAAYMLTEGLPGLQRFEGTKEAYLKRAARWFIANLARSLASGGRETTVEATQDQWVELLPFSLAQETMVAPGADEPVMEGLVWEEMDRLVGRLPEADQQVYRLCIKEGYNCKEAAEALGWGHAAARKRMERLRVRLRRFAQEIGLFEDRGGGDKGFEGGRYERPLSSRESQYSY